MSLIDYMDWCDEEAHLRRMAANAFSEEARKEFLRLADEVAARERQAKGPADDNEQQEQGSPSAMPE